MTDVYFEPLLTVPFEEDDKDPSIWFLDHNYHEAMYSMSKRINGTSYHICLPFYQNYVIYDGKLTKELFFLFSKGACCGMVQHRPKVARK